MHLKIGSAQVELIDHLVQEHLLSLHKKVNYKFVLDALRIIESDEVIIGLNASLSAQSYRLYVEGSFCRSHLRGSQNLHKQKLLQVDR